MIVYIKSACNPDFAQKSHFPQVSNDKITLFKGFFVKFVKNVIFNCCPYKSFCIFSKQNSNNSA